MLRMGLGPRRRAGAGPALLRTSLRRLCPRLSAGQDSPRSRGAGTTSNRLARCCSPGPTWRTERNRYAIKIPPPFGSLIGRIVSPPKEVGLTAFPPQDRPPVRHPVLRVPDHGRLRPGHAGARLGRQLSELQASHRAEPSAALADVPELSAAVHCDHYRLVHRRSRPPALGGLWRVANRGCHDAVPDGARGDDLARHLLRRSTPSSSLFGTFYIYRLLRTGPAGQPFEVPHLAVPNRPMSLADEELAQEPSHARCGRITMVMFWVRFWPSAFCSTCCSTAFDLGVGMLFGLANGEARRARDVERGRADLGRQRDLAGGHGGYPVGRLSGRLCERCCRLSICRCIVMLLGLILRGVAFEFRYKTHRMRWIWDLSFAGGSLIATFIQGLTVGALVEGLPIHEWRICRRRVRLAHAVCGALRHRPVSRLCASRRLLAGQEMRGRGPRRRAPPDPCARGRPYWCSSWSSSPMRWPSIFRSCIAGSIGPICSSSRRSARSRQRCSRSAS